MIFLLLLLRFVLDKLRYVQADSYISVIFDFWIYYMVLRTIRGVPAETDFGILFERKWAILGSSILLSIFNHFVLSALPEVTVDLFIANCFIITLVNILLIFINLFTFFCILDNCGNVFHMIFAGIRFIFTHIESIIIVALLYIRWQMAVAGFCLQYFREDLLLYARTAELENLIPFHLITSLITIFIHIKVYFHCASIYERG